jgi:hypothetical protein
MNRHTPLLASLCLAATLLAVDARADNEYTPSPATAAPAAAAPASGVAHVVSDGQTSGGPDEPSYKVSASWVIAGYNDNEVIYSIVIANADSAVIRCATLLSGYYLENGTPHAISDRQSVTLFPGKQSSAGTWVGLDPKSATHYKITCRAVH